MYTARTTWILTILVSLWTVGSPLPAICQSKMNGLNNVCYWLNTTMASFTASQQACAAHGGSLATVDSAETSEFLKNFVVNELGVSSMRIWIGYDENKQSWEDCTPFSWTNYNIGEPSQVSEACTVIRVETDLTWLDYPCTKLKESLCQIQLPGQFAFVGLDEGSTVSVGDCVVVVQTDSVLRCGMHCARDARGCFVMRYIQADNTCYLYNSGTTVKIVDNSAEWFLY